MSKSTAAIGAWLISRARVKRPIRSAAACSSVSPPDGRARQATAPRPSGPSAAWAADACAHGPETRTAFPNGPPAFARAAQTTLPQPRRPDPSSQVTSTLPSPPTATAGSRPPVEPATAVPRPNVPPGRPPRDDDRRARALLVDRAPDDRGVAAPPDAQRDVARDVGAQVGDRLRRGERAARRPDAHLDGVDVGRRAAGARRRGEAHPGDDGAALGVDAEVRGADRVRVQRRGRGLLGPRRAGAADCDQREREQACTQSTHGPPKPTRVQGLRSCSGKLSYPAGRAASPSSDRAMTRRWISDVPS